MCKCWWFWISFAEVRGSRADCLGLDPSLPVTCRRRVTMPLWVSVFLTCKMELSYDMHFALVTKG